MTRQAIVLGSNGPKWQTPLDYAVTDASDVARALKTQCGFNTTLLPHDIRPQDAMANIEGIAGTVTDVDTLVVYFSGHGEIFRGKLFLMLTNTTSDLLGTALNAHHVLDAMQLSRASHKLTILDCCHAGGVGFRGSEVLPVDKDDKTSLVLCASDRLEKARELKTLQAGFMTHNICSILDDHNIIHVTVEYLVNRLRRVAFEHNEIYPEMRVPVPYLFGEARGSFIFRTANPLEAFPLAEISNSMRVNSAMFQDNYIIAVSQQYPAPYKWARIVSEINDSLQSVDKFSSILNIGDLVLGTKEEFWFSVFYEACLNGHRTTMALIKQITIHIKSVDQLYYDGIRAMEGIKEDYFRRIKTEGGHSDSQ
jgi:hypothetical protein